MGRSLYFLSVFCAAALAVVAFGQLSLAQDDGEAQPPSSARFAAIVAAEAYSDPIPDRALAVAEAEILAEAFRTAGFVTRLTPNARTADIHAASFWLAENVAASDGTAGVFVFIGRAAATDQRGYLLGEDARAAGPLTGVQLARMGAAVDGIAERLGAAGATSFMALDVGRPWGAGAPPGVRPGIAAFDPPQGVVVSAAARPGALAPAVRAGAPSHFIAALHPALTAAQPARETVASFRTAVVTTSGRRTFPWVAGDAGSDIVWAPVSPPTLSPAPRLRLETDMGPRYALFITNRILLANEAGRLTFGADADRLLHFGDYRLAPPGPVRAAAAVDPITVLSPSAFSDRLAGANRRAVTVFIPDRGRDLAAAAVEAGACAAILGPDTQVATFSWPSLTEQSPLAAARDARAADRSGVAVGDALALIATAHSGPVVILAEGSGARAAAAGLEALSARTGGAALIADRVTGIVIASADNDPNVTARITTAAPRAQIITRGLGPSPCQPPPAPPPATETEIDASPVDPVNAQPANLTGQNTPDTPP